MSQINTINKEFRLTCLKAMLPVLNLMLYPERAFRSLGGGGVLDNLTSSQLCTLSNIPGNNLYVWWLVLAQFKNLYNMIISTSFIYKAIAQSCY